MTAPNPKRQKEARKILDSLFERSDKVCVVHYSCESFYDREDGRSPRVTSIALRRLDSGQTTSYSIHQAAEVSGVPLDAIDERYDDLEREMLRNFFEHISGFQGMTYLHWNMRDANYGFQAIEHRYRVLHRSDPQHIVDDRDKSDLSRLLVDIYGVHYIGHPRLSKLLSKNKMKPRDFLSGADEARAFEEHDFVALHQSTLRKVDVIANIAARAHDRQLKTNTTWWEMRGGRIVTFFRWLGEHPFWSLLAGLFGLAGVIAAVVALAR